MAKTRLNLSTEDLKHISKSNLKKLLILDKMLNPQGKK